MKTYLTKTLINQAKRKDEKVGFHFKGKINYITFEGDKLIITTPSADKIKADYNNIKVNHLLEDLREIYYE